MNNYKDEDITFLIMHGSGTDSACSLALRAQACIEAKEAIQ